MEYVQDKYVSEYWGWIVDEMRIDLFQALKIQNYPSDFKHVGQLMTLGDDILFQMKPPVLVAQVDNRQRLIDQRQSPKEQ